MATGPRKRVCCETFFFFAYHVSFSFSVDLEGILYLEPANPDAKEQLIQVNELIRFEGGFPVDPSTRYPRVNDEPWEVYYDSDSEDCNHKRNKTPCRFYNHEGCRNGAQCSYSHAPDDKSVRDELSVFQFFFIMLYCLITPCSIVGRMSVSIFFSATAHTVQKDVYIRIRGHICPKMDGGTTQWKS